MWMHVLRASALFFLLPVSCYLPIVISPAHTCIRDIYTRCIAKCMPQKLCTAREALPQPLSVQEQGVPPTYTA